MELASNTKPIMYLFNQPWCGACKRLKETFQQEGERISKLSEKFILVNVGGDDNNAFGVRLDPSQRQKLRDSAACAYHVIIDAGVGGWLNMTLHSRRDKQGWLFACKANAS